MASRRFVAVVSRRSGGSGMGDRDCSRPPFSASLTCPPSSWRPTWASTSRSPSGHSRAISGTVSTDCERIGGSQVCSLAHFYLSLALWCCKSVGV